MKKYIRYAGQYAPTLVEYLGKHGIKYDRSDESMRAHGHDLLVFFVEDTTPDYAQVTAELKRFNLVEVPGITFTEKERNAAEWLAFWSRTTKFEPERVTETFSIFEVGVPKKGICRRLSGKPFYAARQVRHSPHQGFFCALGASTGNLFCTQLARDVLRDLPVVFEPVLHYKTERPIDDMFYMKILHTLSWDAIVVSDSWEAHFCPSCGQKTYFPPVEREQLVVRRQALSAAALICKTSNLFSVCENNYYPFPQILISQELYQRIKRCSIDRGLAFAPVTLV